MPSIRRPLLALLLCCSALLPAHAASSGFWCNERFLRPGTKTFDAQHLRVARRGYLYAVAAALALQHDSAEDRSHFFAEPARLRQVERVTHAPSGFEARVFERLDAAGGQVEELVVAFSGSNDDADWEDTNLGFDQEQYVQARRLLQRLARDPRWAALPRVVTGYSLGGALAVHVTKHAETRRLVQEAWVFNPSPKTWVDGRLDKRIWLAATASDALGPLRRSAPPLPGVAAIGAPANQTAEGFYLLDANPVVSHYRWVLTRNLLHVADLAVREAEGDDAPSEPLEILQASRFSACRR